MFDFYNKYWVPYGELLTDMERRGIYVRACVVAFGGLVWQGVEITFSAAGGCQRAFAKGRSTSASGT
jgi:hypothetical protein